MKVKKLLILSIAIATSIALTIDANDSAMAISLAPTFEATREALPPENYTPLSQSSVPTVRVSVDTNCRTGPGKVYDRVGVLKVGERAEVVGKKISYNYWIIKNPDADGICWLWGKYAIVFGDTSNIPEYYVPSTPIVTIPPSIPTVSVSVDTNCRTGPRKFYDRIGVLKVGESAEVVGKNTFSNYWIIKNPDADGICWLWGKYATVSGNTSNLQEYSVPQAPTVTFPTSSSAPTVSVSVGTNCRTGPGKAYYIVGGLRVGETAEVVGKRTSHNYWIIRNPDASGDCWLWGYYATVVGNTSNLPEYIVPPAP